MQAPRPIDRARVEAVGKHVALRAMVTSADQLEGATTHAGQRNPELFRTRLTVCRLDRMGRPEHAGVRKRHEPQKYR